MKIFYTVFEIFTKNPQVGHFAPPPPNPNRVKDSPSTFFSHENNQTKATKVNQPCNKAFAKMFNSIYIDLKGILSKKRGSVLGFQQTNEGGD